MINSAGNEHELIIRAQSGDRQAFGELVYLHQKGMINVVFRLCGERELAEDAAQEAFIRAWQKLPSYRPAASFRSWLYRIATNIAIDVLRREKQMVDVDKIQILDPSKGAEEKIIQHQKGERVQAAVLALPEASRKVLVLREFQNFSYQEIAETLEIPMGTVMSRLNYARKSLRKSLKKLLEDA